MADPHDLNSEVKLLRRQNRRLKVALLLFVAVLGVSGPVVAIKQSKLAEEALRQREIAVDAVQRAEEEVLRQRIIAEEAVQRAEQAEKADGDNTVESQP